MSERQSQYKKRFLGRLIIFMTVAVYACLLAYGIGIYFRVKAQVREAALVEDLRLMELVNYNAERIIDSVQKTAIGLFYSLDVQTVIHTSRGSDLMYLLSATERVNDIATANTNVLSVELYNHRLARVFAGPNAPPNDEGVLAGLIQDGASLHRLELSPRRIQSLDMPATLQDQILSLFMFDTPPGSTPGSDGALIMNIDPKSLFENFDLLNQGPEKSILCALSTDGKILYSGRFDAGPMGPALLRSVEALGNSGIHQGLARIEGADFILTTATPRGAGFSLLQIRSAALAYSRYGHILNVLPLVSALFIAFPLAVIILVSRRLYQPVGLLVRSVHPGSQKESSVIGSDEFSYLTQVFRSNLRQLESLKEREEYNRGIINTFLLSNLLFDSEHIDREEFLHGSENAFKISFENPFLLILLTVKADNKQALANSDRMKRALMEIGSMVGPLFETVETGLDEFAIIVSRSSNSSIVRSRLIGDLKTAVSNCSVTLGMDFAVAVSEWITDLTKVSQELQRCKNNLHYSYVIGLNVVIQDQDVERYNEDCHSLDGVPNASRLRSSVVYGDLKGFRRTLQAAIRRIARQRIENVMSSASELIGVYVSALRSRRELSDAVLQNGSLSDLRKLLERSPTITSLENDLVSFLQRELNNEDTKGHNKRMILVHAVKTYVAKNFSDRGLYVPKIAAIFKVNPTYLGRVFRSLTGMGLVDYVHFLRIEKAKSLLSQTELTVAEVMENVGFENKSNFYRIFKKSCGMAPREYIVTHAVK